MIHSFIIVLLLVFACFETGLCTNNCTTDLKQLADNQGHYVNCMIHHASPVSACSDCYSSYTKMVKVYTNLVKNCSQVYLNKDRFNIVYNMQKTLVQIWNEGFCDDCFENEVESQSKLAFDNFTLNFTRCLDLHHVDNCTYCYPQYADLNFFYKQMEKEKKGKICFDIQDSMNQTRLKWSKELKCCIRSYNMTAFFIGCSLFGTIPFVFYIGMYAYTKRLESNHEILDSTFESTNEAPIASTSSGGMSERQTNHQNQTITKRTKVPANKIDNEKTPTKISAESPSTSKTNNLINL